MFLYKELLKQEQMQQISLLLMVYKIVLKIQIDVNNKMLDISLLFPVA